MLRPEYYDEFREDINGLWRGDPEIISRLPTIAINYLTIDPRVANFHFHGLLNGDYFRQNLDRFSQNLVPSDEVRKGLLYLNCESYEAMKEGIVRNLISLGRSFGRRDPYNRDVIESIEITGFNVANILKSLDFVEKAMEGMTRNTGEPASAHILRSLQRGIDLIRINNETYNSGHDVVPFTKETSELFLLLITLHDFAEDTKKMDDGTKVPIGDFKINTSVRDGEVKYFIERYDYRKDEDKWRVDKVESLNLELPLEYISYLYQSLVALKSDGEEAQFQYEKLITTVKQLTRKHDIIWSIYTYRFKEDLLGKLPNLVKIIDLADNVATRTFEYDHETNTYIPVKDIEKLINKYIDTINYFPEIEEDLLWMMSNYQYSKYPVTPQDFFKLTLQMRGKLDREAKYHTKIARLLPSRWAMLSLMGMGPNQLFRRNNWRERGPWVPTLI